MPEPLPPPLVAPASARQTAVLDGDFVVFLIGMRVNRWWRPDRWWPVASAMPRMLRELAVQPERGLLHAEMWFGRTTLMLQYWRSLDQLLAYAKDRESRHLPAWRDFNQRLGRDGSVGIWHETYSIGPGRHESIYVHMPAFGLGRAGSLVAAQGTRQSARGRMATHEKGPPG